MNFSGLVLRGMIRSCTVCRRSFSITTSRAGGSSPGDQNTTLSLAQQIDALYSHQPPIPEYRPREGEPEGVKRARLLFQSRKRGMLENGLLLRQGEVVYSVIFVVNQATKPCPMS